MNICMVSDFFYPRLGGVEAHIWFLSQGLLKRGHKVVVFTLASGHRKGIRYMTNGLKVVYAPILPFYEGVSWPTLYAYLPLFRHLLIREEINIVHGHQARTHSNFFLHLDNSHECILFAKTMGLKVVYTDHSLFGFADAASIPLNTLMKFTMSEVDHAIAVSNVCKENLVLRANMNPQDISTIPNAIDSSRFVPDPSKRHPLNKVNIIIISRLTYRKGIDLLVQVIPELCQMFPSQLHFIIGGDGNKRLLLEEMKEKHQLHDCVEMLGAVPPERVSEVLNRGHIFLNCSLTESFCIAILEAASCGLFVVSTKVGGVPEVLPHKLMNFAEPTASSLINAVAESVSLVHDIEPRNLHEEVKKMYSWVSVSERTEVIYSQVLKRPTKTLYQRIQRYPAIGGFWSQLVWAFVAVLVHLLLCFLEFVQPQSSIDIAPAFPLHMYR
ncbi:unnamed protein product [Heterosigma akashiwo]